MPKRSQSASALALSVCTLMCATAACAADLSGVWWIKNRTERIPMPQQQWPLLPGVKPQPLPESEVRCLPDGLPRLLLARYPVQILQRPEQVTLLHERQHMVRLIYLNKEHDPDHDLSYNGEAVGHWEGDELVIDTTGFNGRTAIDLSGIRLSEALHITERLSLRDGGRTLRDVVTIDDPRTFRKPWSFSLDFERRKDVRLMEDVCTYGPAQRDGGRQ